LCSSHCIALKAVLNQSGIEGQLWNIAGHVVLRARVTENGWWIPYPDCRVTIPLDMAAIQANPETVRLYYRHMAGQTILLLRCDFAVSDRYFKIKRSKGLD